MKTGSVVIQHFITDKHFQDSKMDCVYGNTVMNLSITW